MHFDESMVTQFFTSLKRMYDSLGYGISFYDPDTIRGNQIFHHAKWWIQGNIDDYTPNLDKSVAIYRDFNSWQDRIYVTVDSKIAVELIDNYRNYLNSSHDAIKDLFQVWQTESNKNFEYWFKKETEAMGYSIYNQYTYYCAKMLKIQLGQANYSANELFSPQSAVVVHQLKEIFRSNGIEEDILNLKIMEYLLEVNHDQIPYNKIESSLWASVARKAASGQKRLPSKGMVNDVIALSVYMPFCDAMFVDKECHGFLNDEPLKSGLDYNTKIFSLNTKGDFLSFLDSISDNAPKGHFDIINEIYGPGWETPFTTMYEY